MSELVEGRNAVIEALRSGIGVQRVILARGLERSKAIDEIRGLCRERGVHVQDVPKREIESASATGAHQGVMAYVEAYSYTPLEEMLRSTGESGPVLLVALDHVTDPHNLGAIARSVEAVGGAGLIIPERRSAAVGPVAFKTSAGALAHVPVARVTNLVRSLEKCKASGFWVAGTEADAPSTLWEAPLDGRIVLVIGAEGKGMARLTRETCDFTVNIPMRGSVDSLNAAQATSVLAFEWLRRRQG